MINRAKNESTSVRWNHASLRQSHARAICGARSIRNAASWPERGKGRLRQAGGNLLNAQCPSPSQCSMRQGMQGMDERQGSRGVGSDGGRWALGDT
jgi:hypothetical protein